MTPEQISLVRGSVAALGASKEALAAAFFRQLFARDPSLRASLPDEREAERTQFADELTGIVDSLTNLGDLVEETRGLGSYLAQHGVRVSHYATGRAALMAALDELLGEQFDPATREAWGLACNLVAECMMAGASRR